MGDLASDGCANNSVANGRYRAALLEGHPSPALLQDAGHDSSLIATQQYSQQYGSQQIHQQSCSQLATQCYSQDIPDKRTVTGCTPRDNTFVLERTGTADGTLNTDKRNVVASLSEGRVKAAPLHGMGQSSLQLQSGLPDHPPNVFVSLSATQDYDQEPATPPVSACCKSDSLLQMQPSPVKRSMENPEEISLHGAGPQSLQQLDEQHGHGDALSSKNLEESEAGASMRAVDESCAERDFVDQPCSLPPTAPGADACTIERLSGAPLSPDRLQSQPPDISSPPNLREIPMDLRCHSSEMTPQAGQKHSGIPEVAMADAPQTPDQQDILVSSTAAGRAEDEPNSLPVLWMLNTLCPEAEGVSAETPVAPALDRSRDLTEAEGVSTETPVAPVLNCSQDLTEAEGVSTETPVVPSLNCSRDLSKVVDTSMEAVACSPELLPAGKMQAGAPTEKKADGNADTQPLPLSDSMFSTLGYGECRSSQGHSEGVAHDATASSDAAIGTSKISETETCPPEESLVMTQCYRDTELSCENGAPQAEVPDLDSSMLLTQAYTPEVQGRNTGNLDMDPLLTQEYVAPARTDEVLPTQDWRSNATCSSGSTGLGVRGGSMRKAGNARCKGLADRMLERGVALASFGAPVGSQAAPITVPLTQDSPGAILLGSYDPGITVQLSQSLPPPPFNGASDICAYVDGTMSGGPSDAVEEMLTQVYTAPDMDLDLQPIDARCKGNVGSLVEAGSTKSLTAGNLKLQNLSHLLPPAAPKMKRSKATLGQPAWSSGKSLPDLFAGYDFAAAPVRDVLDDSDDEQKRAGRKKRGGKIAAQPALVQKEHAHVRRGRTIACTGTEHAMTSARRAGVSSGDTTTDGAASKQGKLPTSKVVPKKRERAIAVVAGDEQVHSGRGKTIKVNKQQQHCDPEVGVLASPKRKRGRPKKSQTPSPTEVPRVPSLELAKENDETPSRTHGNFPEESLWTPPKLRLHGKQRPPILSKPTFGGSSLENQQQDAVQNGGKAVADKASEQQCTVEATSCGAKVAAIESGESVMSPMEIFRSLLA